MLPYIERNSRLHAYILHVAMEMWGAKVLWRKVGLPVEIVVGILYRLDPFRVLTKDQIEKILGYRGALKTEVDKVIFLRDCGLRVNVEPDLARSVWGWEDEL